MSANRAFSSCFPLVAFITLHPNYISKNSC